MNSHREAILKMSNNFEEESHSPLGRSLTPNEVVVQIGFAWCRVDLRSKEELKLEKMDKIMNS